MSGMRRSVLAALLAAGLAVPLTSGPAWACSCIYQTSEEQASSARVVFTGRVLDVTIEDMVRQARMRVRMVYKGEVDRRVSLVTARDGGACGFGFREDRRYTVFSGDRREPISVSLCSGTTKGAIDPAEYGLPPGSPP